MLVEVVVVLEAVPGVPGISKRVKKAAVEQVPLQLHILLQVEVLEREEISKRGVV
jgi:hypothetical protein